MSGPVYGTGPEFWIEFFRRKTQRKVSPFRRFLRWLAGAV